MIGGQVLKFTVFARIVREAGKNPGQKTASVNVKSKISVHKSKISVHKSKISVHKSKISVHKSKISVHKSKIDELVKSRKNTIIVIPAKTGVRLFQDVDRELDTGFHRCDDF